MRAHPGEAGETFARHGVSLRRLVTLAGSDPGAIGYVVVPRPDGTSAYLPGADLAEPPPFENGLPVLVSADSGCIRFLRPATGPEDANAEDNFASCGAPLTIGVRDGNVLTVRASASDSAPTAGETVRFEAVAEGAKPGEAISGYRWSFGDGTGGEGAVVTHAFAAEGSYKVTVVATGSAESGGEAVPLVIVVGSPVVTGTGAGAKKNNGKSTAHPGKGIERGEGVVGGPVVGPLHSRTAGRFAQGSDNRPDEPVLPTAPGKVAQPAPALTTPATSSESTTSEKRAPESEHRKVAAGRLVEGQLVADFIDAGEVGSVSSGGSSESVAAAPASGSGAVPVTAILAGLLLSAGAAYEWRRQGRRRAA